MNFTNQSSSAAAATDLVLVNPAAGAGSAARALPALREFARRHHWDVEFCVTASAEDLAAKAHDAVVTGYSRLFVLGGDGTFHVMLNAVGASSDLVLGILPAGGGNDLAMSLGLPADPARAAELLLHGETFAMDAVRVCTAEGREHLYCGGGGVGLDAEACRYASSAYRHVPGRLRYLLSAIRALVSFRAPRMRICMQYAEPSGWHGTALLAGVLNTPSYGAGLRLAPEARTDDGLLHLVLLGDLTFLEIFRLLPSLSATGELKTDRVRRFPVSRVRIETEPPCLFQGDGEILGTTPVEISVVPKVFRILRPGSQPGI